MQRTAPASARCRSRGCACARRRSSCRPRRCRRRSGSRAGRSCPREVARAGRPPATAVFVRSKTGRARSRAPAARTRRRRCAPTPWALAPHEAAAGDRLALEGARDAAVGGVAASFCLASVGQPRLSDLRGAMQGAAGSRPRRANAYRQRAPAKRRTVARAARRCAAAALARRASRPPRAAGRPRRPRRARASPVGVRARAERDQVGELGDGVEVAELGQPREAERVEPVAGEQREVGVGGVARRAASP